MPRRKIFPFLSLPAELRNRIYLECLPPPTKAVQLCEGEDVDDSAIWFESKQKSFRRTIQYIPSLIDPTSGQVEDRFADLYDLYRPPQRLGTGRGRPSAAGAHDQDSDSDSENGDQSTMATTFSLNILAVCKQIYEEAAPMIFTRRLVFVDPDALFSFASALSPRT